MMISSSEVPIVNVIVCPVSRLNVYSSLLSLKLLLCVATIKGFVESMFCGCEWDDCVFGYFLFCIFCGLIFLFLRQKGSVGEIFVGHFGFQVYCLWFKKYVMTVLGVCGNSV